MAKADKASMATSEKAAAKHGMELPYIPNSEKPSWKGRKEEVWLDDENSNSKVLLNNGFINKTVEMDEKQMKELKLKKLEDDIKEKQDMAAEAEEKAALAKQ